MPLRGTGHGAALLQPSVDTSARRDAFADVAAAVLVRPSAFGSTPPEWMGRPPENEQATGMASAQLDVSVAEVLIRAYPQGRGPGWACAVSDSAFCSF